MNLSHKEFVPPEFYQHPTKTFPPHSPATCRLRPFWPFWKWSCVTSSQWVYSWRAQRWFSGLFWFQNSRHGRELICTGLYVTDLRLLGSDLPEDLPQFGHFSVLHTLGHAHLYIYSDKGWKQLEERATRAQVPSHPPCKFIFTQCCSTISQNPGWGFNIFPNLIGLHSLTTH